MTKLSAGLVVFRRRVPSRSLELFLVRPGGPFFRAKDDGFWSIPKGQVEEGDEPLARARKEFQEETGFAPPEGNFLPLGEVRQKGGKRVVAWAIEGDCDPGAIQSNTFEMEWPPRTGRRQKFPEVDRAGFFPPDLARRKLNPAQAELVARLENELKNED
ncbi:MAG: NUDIX domain-containing protein [Vicinamibacteria bacterium]